MLSVFATDIKDNTVDLPTPYYMVINQQVDVPADDMNICFLHIENLPELKYIYVLENDTTVFSGVVDEQQIISDSDKSYIKILARSMASLLLDNESEPVNYTNPSTSVIFEKHLKPLGFEKYTGEDMILYGSLNITKGTSNWQAFKSFCLSAYGKIPRIEADGTANFSGIKTDRELYFSNQDGMKYNSIKENIKRHPLISKVYVKTTEDKGYELEINNEDALERGIEKVRYVDITNSTSTIETAKIMIENSVKNSYEITLVCPERYLDILGLKATVESKRDKLFVSSVQYCFGKSGHSTTIKLKKEN